MPPAATEHLLAIVPFAEPTSITNRIRRDNPEMRITWIRQDVHPLDAWMLDTEIDPGMVCQPFTAETRSLSV
jgi:hypothetical protein